jgi:hypothetical protein
VWPGDPFVLAKVRAIAGNGECHYIGVIAFVDGPAATLLALPIDDRVAITGELSVKAYTHLVRTLLASPRSAITFSPL